MTDIKRAVVKDDYGSYEVAEGDILATAKKRRDGWFDLRTKDGRDAARAFYENMHIRAAEFHKGAA